MKKTILMEKYPIFELKIPKNETKYTSVDEIIEYFKSKIETHPVAAYIATFDHYDHTKSLSDGSIASEILDAKNIIFCFGKELPKPHVMSIRPRSIGVAEFKDSFFVGFMEAPNPAANDAMESWIKGLIVA